MNLGLILLFVPVRYGELEPPLRLIAFSSDDYPRQAPFSFFKFWH